MGGWSTRRGGVAAGGIAVLAVVCALMAGCGSVDDSAPAPAEATSSTIAFTRGREIWAVRADGGDPRRLVAPEAHGGSVQDPQWSPEGDRIAFLERGRGSGIPPGRIVVMGADGAGRRAVSPPGPISSPAWSPDGRSIAYLRSRIDRRGRELFATDVWIAPVRGGAPRRVAGPPGGSYEFSWSPDGRFLALAGVPRACGCGNSELYVVGADGEGLRNLSRTPYEERDPDWMPDGHTISIIQRAEVVLVDARDGTRRSVTRGGRAYQAVPSPDGHRIALIRWEVRDGLERPSLWLADPAGGALTPLVTGKIVGIAPRWSPGGDAIAFAAQPVPRTRVTPWNVHLVDLATHRVHPVTRFGGRSVVDGPVFRPGEPGG